MRLTPRHYAYLKISEGCDHACAFCIIPQLRGPPGQPPAAKVLAEAEALVDAGVQELLVISQDTSAYGRDLAHTATAWRGRPVRAHVVDLAEALSDLGVWVRLHYVYPTREADDLIPLMAEGRILPYLDIPSSTRAPRCCARCAAPAATTACWRRSAAGANRRPTSPCAPPSSSASPARPRRTSACCWTSWRRRSWTASAAQVRERRGRARQCALRARRGRGEEERWHRFMQAQQEVSARRMAAKVGRRIDVIIDEVDAEGAIGRSSADAPEIDGAVFLNGDTGVASATSWKWKSSTPKTTTCGGLA